MLHRRGAAGGGDASGAHTDTLQHEGDDRRAAVRAGETLRGEHRAQRNPTHHRAADAAGEHPEELPPPRGGAAGEGTRALQTQRRRAQRAAGALRPERPGRPQRLDAAPRRRSGAGGAAGGGARGGARGGPPTRHGGVAVHPGGAVVRALHDLQRPARPAGADVPRLRQHRRPRERARQQRGDTQHGESPRRTGAPAGIRDLLRLRAGRPHGGESAQPTPLHGGAERGRAARRQEGDGGDGADERRGRKGAAGGDAVGRVVPLGEAEAAALCLRQRGAAALFPPGGGTRGYLRSLRPPLRPALRTGAGGAGVPRRGTRVPRDAGRTDDGHPVSGYAPAALETQRRMDDGIPRAVRRGASPDSGGVQLQQAHGGDPCPAAIQRGGDLHARDGTRDARHAERGGVRESERHQREARLRRNAVAGDGELVLRAGVPGDLRPPLPERRAAAHGICGEDPRGTEPHGGMAMPAAAELGNDGYCVPYYGSNRIIRI